MPPDTVKGTNKLVALHYELSGGGGTRAGCVSDYIVKHNLKPDCLVMLTDGYIESKVVWDTKVKSLWMVTHNEILVPPNGGRKVNVIK